MDEPLSDLDAKLKVEIRKEIQRVHKRVKKPTLYVTHDQEEAMSMSDRIVVLNDGQIEQRGTPDELYTRPQNTFVANFIGNPSMNFLNGQVISGDDGAITIEIEDQTFSFGANTVDGRTIDGEVTIGFRPEDINVYSNGSGDLSGHLALVERIGDSVLASIERSSGEIRATVPADNSLTEDEPVSFSFDESLVHIFERDSGKIVARGH